MRFVKTTLVAVAVLSAVSCSSTRVNSDRDSQADFSSYSTFSWYAASEPDRPPTHGASQIVDGRIRRALDDGLVAKGYSQAGPGVADLEVAYYTSLSSQLRMYNGGWGYGWGYGPRWGYGYGYWPGWNMTTVSTYLEGTIIVDIIDRKQNQLVWRGVITSALSKKSSSDEKIEQAMNRVLSDFPAR
ncbi:MAG: DUF4136 domain-containing protein [Acidobacteriota bacterium]|nr:DUF4136 domain-containing protein [Acidobacteriota bacterium]